MAHLIDKDAILAEIKRRINNLEKLGNRLYIKTNFPEQYRLIHGYESVLSFIDTIEVREVDVENLQEEPVSENLEEAASLNLKNFQKK